jgi:hypothetical protein
MFEAAVRSHINVNVNKPIKGVTYGCKNSASRIAVWHQNLRILKGISAELGIAYLPFLQPTSLYTGGKADTDDERLPAINSFYAEAVALAKTSGFIIDATSALDGISNAYADFVHYTESGNKMIAEFVFRYILSDHGKENIER